MVGDWTRRSAGGSAVVAAVLGALAPGCSKDFSGPYPCNAGFGSCSTPDQCETDLTGDPQHCGSCGQSCPRGALCANSACTQAPPTLSTDVTINVLAVNATDVFFWSRANTVTGLPKNGGSIFTVYTGQNPQNGAPFAVDDARLYYVAQDPTSPGPGQTVVEASPASPSDGGTPQSTVVGTFPMMGSGTPGSLSAMALASGTLFMAGNYNGGLLVASVPTSGGAVTPVTTFGNGNGGGTAGFAVDASNVYAVSNSQGTCEIDRAPVTGGNPSTLVATQNQGCASIIASDGRNVYWVANYSRYLNNSNNNQCFVAVGSAPVAGGSSATLTDMPVDEVPLRIAADGSSVYFATNASLWKVPVAGGAASRIAGNLGVITNSGSSSKGGNGSGGCSFNSGGLGTNGPLALALDATSVYLAIQSSAAPPPGNSAVLLKIPK